ncbi:MULTISPECIES: diguanylate cyclase [unclassified Sulfuricurvum]|uniref:diguanylate cyclase n=1 Tax=unclassified Sulfuricurvum TaxID=2632390 RepID=UPI000A65C8A0|nr:MULTISPECIES: diguanylate cyclase [unclassified Sulfuricurvum]
MNPEMSVITPSTHLGDLFDAAHRCKTFEGDTIVQHVLEFFSFNNADAVIITQQSSNVGILTVKDLVRIVHNCDNLGLPIREFMSSPLETFESETAVSDVIEAMDDIPFDKIVAADGKNVVGIIDKRHLMALCYRQITPIVKQDYGMIHSLMGLVGEGEKGLLKLATTDTLTGIGNRRLFEEIFQSYQKNADNRDYSLYLLLFDVDNFKSINDTFGHNVGDSVLKQLTDLVASSIRKTDTFVRWGGEEFAILQRYSDPMAVMKVADQIRKKIDECSFETIVHVTCSFGLTSVQPAEALESVFERADKALYRAKSDGKNCIRIQME